MSKRKVTDRQFVQKMYKDTFDNYDENEFMDFFDNVMKQINNYSCSLAQAFYFCAIDKLNIEARKELEEPYETKD